MSTFILIIGICTGLAVFLAIALCIVYAWNYSYIRMSLIFEHDKKEVKKFKLFKVLIKLSSALAVILALLYLILIFKYGEY